MAVKNMRQFFFILETFFHVFRFLNYYCSYTYIYPPDHKTSWSCLPDRNHGAMCFCLDQNYFIFNGWFRKQGDYLSMGRPPLSQFLSDIFQANFEKSFLLYLTSPFMKNIKFRCRYVNDVLCLWTGTELQIHNSFKQINAINPTIHFSMEI